MIDENYKPQTTEQKLAPGQVGIAGEYAVLSELIANGFAAGRTDGNSEDIDILCSDTQTGRTANIQVKTLSRYTNCFRKSKTRFKFRVAGRKSYDDMLEKKIETIRRKQIFYVFCALSNPDIKGREKDRFFIATPEQVIAQIKERVKKKTGVIDFRLYEKPEHTNIPEGGYGLIADYEDRWDRLAGDGLDFNKNEV